MVSARLALSLGGVLCMALGCDRSSELVLQESTTTDHGKLVTVNTDNPNGVQAVQILNDVTDTYQRLEFYEDRAFVELSYRLDDQPMVDRVPMEVAWDSQGGVGLKVYSVTAGPLKSRPGEQVGKGFHRWGLELGAGPEAQWNQVLSRARPDRVDLRWLTADPVATSGMSAGLAGFPLQLKLLLDGKPFEESSNAGDAQIAGVVDLAGRSCYLVVLKQSGFDTKLWIDQAEMLVRQVELPTTALPPAMLDDQRVSQVKLLVKYEGIETRKNPDWSRFAILPQEHHELVRYFVQPPPKLDAAGIAGGQRPVPAFEIDTPLEGQVFRLFEHAGKAKVFLWLADHPACELAASQLARVQRELERQHMSEQVAMVAVWAEPDPPPGLSFAELQKRWQLPGQFVLDSKALGRDLFRVQAAPTLVVLDKANRVQLAISSATPQLEEVLFRTLQQISSGVDLTKERATVARGWQDRYEADLALAAALDGKAQKREVPAHFPVAFRLDEVDRQQREHHVVASCVDENQSYWELHEEGQLIAFNDLGQPSSKFNTQFRQSKQSKHAWLLPSPTAGSPAAAYLACIAEKTAIVDARSGDVVEVPISRSEVLSANWLVLSQSKEPRLLIITNQKQTMLLDPRNREQLQASTEHQPTAAVPHHYLSGHQPGVASIIMSNRRVEPLMLDGNSTLGGLIANSKPISDSKTQRRKLDFQPGGGRWLQGSDAAGKLRLLLAHGWIAPNEPAALMLDETLAPRWHIPLPLHQPWHIGQTSTAVDPKTGLPVWLVQVDETFFLIRGDATGGDHFKFPTHVDHACLQTVGDQLVLRAATGNLTTTYRVVW